MREVTIELKVEAPEDFNMAFLTDCLVSIIHAADDRNEVVEYGCHGIDREEQDKGFAMSIKAGFITDIVSIF
jgi:hypothetical protein